MEGVLDASVDRLLEEISLKVMAVDEVDTLTETGHGEHTGQEMVPDGVLGSPLGEAALVLQEKVLGESAHESGTASPMGTVALAEGEPFGATTAAQVGEQEMPVVLATVEAPIALEGLKERPMALDVMLDVPTTGARQEPVGAAMTSPLTIAPTTMEIPAAPVDMQVMQETMAIVVEVPAADAPTQTLAAVQEVTAALAGMPATLAEVLALTGMLVTLANKVPALTDVLEGSTALTGLPVALADVHALPDEHTPTVSVAAQEVPKAFVLAV